MTSETGATSQPPAAADSARIEAPPSSGARRRLTRSRRDRWMAGVAGGLAEYFGADPLLLRIAFVLLALITGGAALIFYVIAAFVIPDDPADIAVARRGSSAAAGVMLGLILVGVGAVWLLAALDVQTPRWDVVLAAALIAVGGLIVITAGRAGSGGLIFLALLMTVTLSGLASFDLRVDSAFSERLVRPTSAAALQDEYSHAFGSFTLDLTSIELPEGTTRIRVSNAFGETIVRVPARAAVKVDASTVFGETRVFNRSFSGFGANETEQTPDYERASNRLAIEVNTAFGSTEVRR